VSHARRSLKRVALGSGNPAKRRAVEAALRRLAPHRRPQLVCFEVASGVRDQPWGDDETLQGADNRAAAALQRAGASGAPDGPAATHSPDGTIGIGIEGGLMRVGPVVWSFSWAVALDLHGARGAARSAAFALPPRVAALLEAGSELGDAIDRTFGVQASKRAEGAVGLLTAGALDRPGLYAPMVVLALVPLLHAGLFDGPSR